MSFHVEKIDMNFAFLGICCLYSNVKGQSKSEFRKVKYLPCPTVLISVLNKIYLFLITATPVIILCLKGEELKHRKTRCNKELNCIL